MKAFTCALIAVIGLAGTAYGRVVINGATSIVIGANEPGPLQKAAADLAGDFTRVFGQRAAILHSPAP